jgi:malonate-semialdehyde dehydrogenase (acetylating) / methylmalonate-semialdehyde dehydrogenase
VPIQGSGDRFSHVTNPATGEVTARLTLGTVADVEAAVTVAKAAFPRWRDTFLARRAEVVFRFRELLDARAAERTELITVEHGKVRSEARGEVARAARRSSSSPATSSTRSRAPPPEMPRTGGRVLVPPAPR